MKRKKEEIETRLRFFKNCFFFSRSILPVNWKTTKNEAGFFKEFNKGEEFNKVLVENAGMGNCLAAEILGSPFSSPSCIYIYLHCFIKLSDDEQ